jgi:hypothetical protein
LYGKFKGRKTLTTQVVRRTDFKTEERHHQGEKIKIIREEVHKIRGIIRYNHEYTTKLLIK